jgi:hypothetical protein
VVACVVVEVKVQQRRPDGGSIPPIARIVFLFCPDHYVQQGCLKLSLLGKDWLAAARFFEAGGWCGACVDQAWRVEQTDL